MRTRQILSLAAAILVTLALLAGCAPAAPATTPAPKPSTAPPAATTAAPSPVTPSPSPTQPTKPATPQPKAGGTLTIPVSTGAAGYDLHQRTSYAAVYALPVFSNLIRFDPGKKDPIMQNVVGDLAEKWEASADGKGLTFFLRKNVKFHNGTPFNADDVVYSFQKMLDPKRSALSSNLATIASVDKVDDFTVKLTLKNASPSLVGQLAGPYAVIQSKATATVDARSTDFLMGTGPFKYKAFTSGVSMDLAKNADYFKPGLPYLDGLRLNIIADQSAQLSALVSKRVDMTGTLYGIRNAEEMDLVKKQAPEVVIEWRDQTPGQRFWLNFDFAPFKDIRVRQAIAMAIDVKQLVAASAGSDDWAVYDTGIFTSAYAEPAEQIRAIFGWDKPYEQRVATAKKLMADAGFAGGFKMRLAAVNNPTNVKKLQVTGDLLKRALNIDYEIVAQETASINKLRDTKDYDIIVVDSQAVLGDPDETMGYFLTGSPTNFSKYSNPAADALWKQQTLEMDPVKRLQQCRQIEKIILTDVLVIPTQGSKRVFGWWPYVKNFVSQEWIYGSSLSFDQVWLDK
jgi:peptide/nickel transport system substrate-binding protein